MRITYVIVSVSDMNRSVAFYRDLLGIPLKFESSHWTEFATEGSTLALHIASAKEDSDAAAGPASEPVAGQGRPGLSVPHLDEFHARMIASGVRCLAEPKLVFGARIAQYADPDGLAISVSEASTR